MTDATRATTFDDLGSELNVFDTATNRFVYRYVDFERDRSMLAVPGQVVDLGDHAPGTEDHPRQRPRTDVRREATCCSSRSCTPTRSRCSASIRAPASPSQILTQHRARVHRRHHAAGSRGLARRRDHVRREHADRGHLVPRRSPSGALTRQGYARGRRHRPDARSDRRRQRRSPLRDARGSRTAMALHAVLLGRRAEVVRPLSLAEPS